MPVCVGGVTVDKLFAFVDTVNRAAERSVALRRSRFAVALGNGDIPFFQNVCKALACYLVPFNRRRLIFRNDIADGGLDFLQRVACADQNITEMRLTCAVGNGVFVHRKPRKRSAEQMKFYALI